MRTSLKRQGPNDPKTITQCSTELYRPINHPPHLTQSSTFDVVNLIPQTFAEIKLEILGLGLNFCPTRDADHFEIVKDINMFARKLNFKTY